jgi:hypothetical protein
MASKKSAANRALGEAIRSARRDGLDRSCYGAIERGEYNVTVDAAAKVAAGLAHALKRAVRAGGL